MTTTTNTPARNFITLSRAWYGEANLTNRRDDALDQINLQVGEGEASLTLYGSCNGWRFEVFDDAAAAFAPFAARLLTILAQNVGRAAIEKALAQDGFTDATPLTM